jgi:nitrite reductase/ring-hydroxylating ferredoxin subunit
MIRHPVRPLDDINPQDLARLAHAGRTYALNRDTGGAIFGPKSQCTHWQVHPDIAGVMGDAVECPSDRAGSTTRPALRSEPMVRPPRTSTEHVLVAQ